MLCGFPTSPAVFCGVSCSFPSSPAVVCGFPGEVCGMVGGGLIGGLRRSAVVLGFLVMSAVWSAVCCGFPGSSRVVCEKKTVMFCGCLRCSLQWSAVFLTFVWWSAETAVWSADFLAFLGWSAVFYDFLRWFVVVCGFPGIPVWSVLRSAVFRHTGLHRATLDRSGPTSDHTWPMRARND